MFSVVSLQFFYFLAVIAELSAGILWIVRRWIITILYTELCYREFGVDVGVVEYCYKDENKKSKRAQLEIDFVANKGSKKYYIQSDLIVGEEEKRQQEVRSLNRVGDSFKKIVVVKDNIIPWHDEKGILYIGIERFLLDENAIDI